jgi:hypothetical protein
MTDVNAVPVTPPVAAPVVKVEAPKVDIKAPVADSKVSPEAKEISPALKEVIRKIKVGETEYDETTLQQLIEKSKGADKKFLEAARSRKEAIKFFKLAKENPEEMLSKTGKDPKQWAYEKVAKDLQDKLRDPREVELEKAQDELKRFREADAQRQAQIRSERLDQETKAMKTRFESEIIEALEATPTLPKNGFTIAQIAKYIDTVRDKTGVLLSAKEVVNVVENDIKSTVKGILAGADAEKLRALIGDEGLAVLRKYELDKLKDPLKGPGASNQKADDSPKSEKRWKTSHEYWKSMDDAAKRERGV